VTRAAGALAAVVELAIEAEELPALPETSQRTLELLPLALRYGAADDAPLALMRAGARPRVLAHLLASHTSPPPGETDLDRLLAWAADQLGRLDELVVERRLAGDDSSLLFAFLMSRTSR